MAASTFTLPDAAVLEAMPRAQPPDHPGTELVGYAGMQPARVEDVGNLPVGVRVEQAVDLYDHGGIEPDSDITLRDGFGAAEDPQQPIEQFVDRPIADHFLWNAHLFPHGSKETVPP